MGFNPPVPQQYTNTEIRGAVLLSLLFQIVLIFAGPVRKRSASAFPSFVIWSSYLLADWVADLALGLLLNNMGNIGCSGGGGLAFQASGCRGTSPIIFAFWAPFLLLHLGGPDTITAYSLADNELWLRHLLGLIFEIVAVAAVFLPTLQGNPMIAATVLVFVAGVIKYGERTYSLYAGSTAGFAVSILSKPDVRPYNYPRLLQVFSSRRRAGLHVDLVTVGHSGEALRGISNGTDEVSAHDLFCIFRPIFVRGVVSTRDRNMSEAFYKAQDANPSKAFKILELELNYTYDMLYTKMPVLRTTAGYVLRFVACCCVIASLIIFGVHDKADMLPVDVGITYALLASAVVLDAVAVAMLLFSDWTVVFLHKSRHSKLAKAIHKARQWWKPPLRWSGTVCQMNLIKHSFRTRESKRGGGGGFLRRSLTKVAVVLRIGDMLDRFEPLDRIKHGDDQYEPLSPLLHFIFHRIKVTVDGAPTSEQRKKACEYRGEGGLEKLLEKHPIEWHNNLILNSVRQRDFDESVLLWHIATDLCFCDVDELTGETKSMMSIGKCLSEYMLYLLLKKPEMMSATLGIGQLRYSNTCEGARVLFESAGKDQDARQVLLKMDTTGFTDFIEGDRTKTVLFNACLLAESLRALDEDLRWLVVVHVWAQMLTYTAASTHPREHLHLLSHGGELITIVWFLMAHMGMTSSMYEVQGTDTVSKLIVRDK